MTALWLGGERAAQAHILLVDPKPRDNNDTHKSDATPCQPARSPAQPVTMMDAKGVAYAGGTTITVKFNETTNHLGCFAIDISPADDKGWVMLGTLMHKTAPATPRPYETTVKLPDGMACDQCTLRVRQFMLNANPATCPPATVPPGQTYFQCANVVVKGGATTVPDAGAPMGGADGGGGMGGGGTGGSTPTGGMSGTGGGMATGGTTGTGGKPATGGTTGSTGGAGGEEEETGGTGGGRKAPGGCSVGGNASGGLLAIAALALLIRRRRR